MLTHRSSIVGALLASLASTASAGKRWVAAGGVVFQRDGKIALIKQRKNGESRWTLPKGRVDPGESSRQAAIRETNEEAGLKARVTGFYGRHEGRRHETDYFRMELYKDRRTHDREVVKVKFVTLRKAKKLVGSRRDQRVIEAASNRQMTRSSRTRRTLP